MLSAKVIHFLEVQNTVYIHINNTSILMIKSYYRKGVHAILETIL